MIDYSIYNLDPYEISLLSKESYGDYTEALHAEKLRRSIFLDQERVSDVIGEEYKEWAGDSVKEDFMGPLPVGDYVYINSGTGTGKTYFIFNVLAPYAKETGDKILYLCNRVALKADAIRLKEELGADNVDIKTYHAVEKIIADSKKTIDDRIPVGSKVSRRTDTYAKNYKRLSEYKYIVADEMHYFLEDADFNQNTHYVHEFLLKPSPQIKILISATGTYATEMFSGKIKHQYTAKSDKSYMKVRFYKDNRKEGHDIPLQYIKKTLNERPNDKILYFVDKQERIEQIWNENEELREEMYCMFSESQDDLYGIRNNECINPVGDEEDGDITFERRLLLATSVLSNGVTLRDRNIKHIICDIKDIQTAIQCIGRKRPYDKRDTCSVYIRYYHPMEFEGLFQRAVKGYDFGHKLASMRDTLCHEWGRVMQKNYPDVYYIDWLNGGVIKPNYARIEAYYQTIQVCNKMKEYDTALQESESPYDSSHAYVQTFKYYGGIPEPIEVLKENERRYFDYDKIKEILEPYDGTCYEAKSEEITELKTALKNLGIKQKEFDAVFRHAGYIKETKRISKLKKTVWEIKKKPVIVSVSDIPDGRDIDYAIVYGE